jgi:hypothetical protein
MTKEFPNDAMTNLPVKPLIRAWGLFRHFGLGISHSTPPQGFISVVPPHS